MINRQTRTRRSERRRDVANSPCKFARQGWTQGAISRHTRIPQASVPRDVAAIVVFRSAKARTFAKRKATDSLVKQATVPLGRNDLSRRLSLFEWGLLEWGSLER